MLQFWPLSPYLSIFVDEFPVFVALKNMPVVIFHQNCSNVFFIASNIGLIPIFTDDLEDVGGSSVLPCYGRVNVSRQTSPVIRDPVSANSFLLLRSQKVFHFISPPIILVLCTFDFHLPLEPAITAVSSSSQY